ncbi:MAG: alpha-L-fucosidase, partial [Cyclobacteriaceae bacterium]
MKNYIITLICLLMAIQSFGQNAYQERQARTEWFRNARFGMFIHWGIYAIPARGEWVRNQQPITLEDYQIYFDTFDPVDYDP